jgi:hypothetical protein
MSSWFKINLGDAMLANEVLAEIKTSLSNVYEQAEKSEDMLAIYRHESAGLHCSLVVYLTSEFQRTAMLENTQRCNPPPLSDSGFLAGHKARMHQ